MRVAIGGIVHETNTFAVASFGTTTVGSFAIARSEEMLGARGTRTFIGGMLAGAEAAGHEVVPIFHANAQPSGTIEAGSYRAMRAELVSGIAAAMPIDAVVLDTHGAGVVEGIDDLEADLGAEIRTVIGPDTPLLTTLDLHGNITSEMAGIFDLMLGCYDYPHIDMYECGIEAIDAVPRLVSGKWNPTTHVERIPFLVPTSTTDEEPAKGIRQRCLDAQREPGVLRATFFHGFPYTDIPEAGASVVVTTNNDPALARSLARRIATEIWDRRADFTRESRSPEIALRQAMRVVADRGGPVVVNDTADNPGAGAPGDSTHVLRALIELNPDRACFGYIFDPDVARQAHQAGAGATIDVMLGGKHDELHGSPLQLRVYVKALTDGRFVYTTPMLGGARANYGPMARLQVGGRDGLDVLVGSRRSQVFDREVFTLNGIDVNTRDLIVLKSSQHFRAGFASFAKDIVSADSPGLSTLRIENFVYHRLDGPRYPLDPGIGWSPGASDTNV